MFAGPDLGTVCSDFPGAGLAATLVFVSPESCRPRIRGPGGSQRGGPK